MGPAHDTGGAAGPAVEVEDATPDGVDRSFRRLVDDALSRRPRFSIRAQLILTFGLLFALCVAANVWFLVELREFNEKVHFLDVSGAYLSEIQQARRFEKNYLLYGTNLTDALEHAIEARTILDRNQGIVERIVTPDKFRAISDHLVLYVNLLEQLQDDPSPEARQQIEGDLREHGASMVLFASEFDDKERAAVDRTLRVAQWTPLVFLGTLGLLVLLIGVSLGRQLLRTLRRFMEYAERIGQGDFTPIQPRKWYQDEFTRLAQAFNQMVEELDRRHRILVESHKLRAIGTLVAGVAHELNNPLNNTMITADLLQERAEQRGDEQELALIQDIIEQTERSTKIVHNLLDFARESKASIEHLDIGEIIQKSVDLVHNQLKLARIDLRLQIQDNLPTVDGDARMLSQVLVNLIINAVDVLPPAGKIRILARESLREEGFLAIEVEDNGPGMPPHVVSQVFDPFFTTKKEGRGTGLGLSVSRGIVRTLGGYLRVKSALGQGTTFTILLPATR
jgi:signal transduction histidine kinase